MADYLLQEDGTSKFVLEDGSGYLLEEGAEVDPSFIASSTLLHDPTLALTNNAVTSTAGTFSWLCPPGVTQITAEAFGGGGGGGNGGNAGSGGGGGGAYAKRVALAVTPGTVYTFVVGAGGANVGATTGNGGPGGDSTFTGDGGVQVIAKGGSGGVAFSSGGAGGQAASSTGDTKFDGGSGAAGVNASGFGGSGGGASGNPAGGGASGASGTSGGVGGAGGTGASGGGSGGTGGNAGTGLHAADGTGPGGGGGGGGALNDTGGHSGAGATGEIRITCAIVLDFIASSTTLYSPAIRVQILAPFIASTTVIYGPTLPPEISAPFISSQTHVWRIFSRFDPNRVYGGLGNGGESFLIRLNANGATETATLAISIGVGGTTTLSLTGDSGLPTDRPFVVTIDAEVILIYQMAPGSYHIRLRAVSNTTASSHTAGATVVWGDSYDMAIPAGTAIANSFTADISSTGSFTYPGWLICFDSSQGYNAAGDRYPMHVAQMLGVFDAGAGSSGTSRCDGAQPSAIHAANAVSDDCPAALTNPARIETDINVGDVAVLRYTNPEATVLDLGGRSTCLQSWFGLKRVSTSDVDVTFTDPNGIVIDTTGTYDTFTGSVNGEWGNPVPLVTGIAPDASDLAGSPIPTPNPVPWTTVTLPASDRYFTRTAIGEKGWPMCCLTVRQGNRRVPKWQSWDWHNYSYVYDGFGTDCTYAQLLINRNGIVFGSVPVVIFPNDDDVDGPDAVWDDGTYYFGASWYVALFSTPYIVAGPTVGGSVVIAGGAGGPVPTVGFGGGSSPGSPVVTPPPNIEGGEGGDIDQPLSGLHVWQTA